MNKQKAASFIGKTLNHKKYGDIYIQEFTSVAEDKFLGVIVETNELKKFVLSRQFFEGPETIGLPHHEELKVVKRTTVKKPYNYEKYRNHPLVKEIDKKEANLYNKIYNTVIVDEEDDDVELDDE